MSKKSSDWYVPLDWIFLFGWMFVMPAVAILACLLLPALDLLKETNAVGLFYSGLGLCCFGIVLLFLARLLL